MTEAEQSSTFEAVGREYIENNNFETWTGRKLIPEDLATTPPAIMKCYRGVGDSVNDYVIHIDYPAGVDDTIVAVEDMGQGKVSYLFNKFARETAEEKGYETKQMIAEDGNLTVLPDVQIDESDLPDQ